MLPHFSTTGTSLSPRDGGGTAKVTKKANKALPFNDDNMAAWMCTKSLFRFFHTIARENDAAELDSGFIRCGSVEIHKVIDFVSVTWRINLGNISHLPAGTAQD